MPDIKTIQDHIRARLAEVQALIEPLRVEAEHLTKMATSFQDQGATAPPRIAPPRPSGARKARKTPQRATRASAAAGPAKRGRPAGSGNRSKQAVAKIAEQPGITVPELAKAMGINPNYLYRVLPRLEKEAKITKHGKGYHPADDAPHTDGQPVPA